MIRGLAIILLLTAACAAPKPAPSSRSGVGQMSTMKMLALANCPERLLDAKAVAVIGEGASRQPREIAVTARMQDRKATAILLKAADSSTETLVLEIRAAPYAVVAGELSFREPVTGMPYSRVIFRCRGAPVFEIVGVETGR